MLNPRNAIILAFVLATLSLLGIVVGLMLPPDSGGMGQDSYGTRASGYRGLYEVLETLKIPVERGLVPPPALLRDGATLAVLAPHDLLVRTEPGYLNRIGEWVRGGGRLVVAPERDERNAWDRRDERSARERHKNGLPDIDDYLSTGTLLDAIGLSGVRLRTADVKSTPTAQTRTDMAGNPTSEKTTGPAWAELKPRPRITVNAVVAGGPGLPQMGVNRLSVPRIKLQEIDTSATTATLQPAGRVMFYDDAGASHTVAAIYPEGRGQVVVFSDPDLLMNNALGKNDNAVLAVSVLIPSGGGPVIFDEFYHGLSIRGNPFWLLTRAPYNLLLLALVLAVAGWVWRGSVALGPPRPAPVARRRTITEYVEAMAGLFHRAGHNRFMLGELRDGTLWWLRQRLRLAPAHENTEAIAHALERTDPAAAARLRATLGDAARLINDSRPLSKKQTLQTAQRMMEWLWMNSMRKSATKSRASSSARTM